MSGPGQTAIRRLGPGDEDVVRRLAEGEPQTALLADERTIFLVAFAGDEPVGFAFGYVLERRHGAPAILFIYELDISEPYRRQGIATRLLRELIDTAGCEESFVLAESDNDEANALYASLGGTRVDSVMWDFA